MHSMNANGGPTAPKTVDSRSLQKRDISKSQKAAELARVRVDGVQYIPCRRELARQHHVPEQYIAEAEKLSPEKRAAMARGDDDTSLSKLLTAPVQLFLFGPPTPGPEQSEPASNGSIATDSNSSAAVELTLPVTTQRVLTTRW